MSSCLFLFWYNLLTCQPLTSFKTPGNSPERGKAREKLFSILETGKYHWLCGQLSHLKNSPWPAMLWLLFMCLQQGQQGHVGVTQRADGHGCEAVVLQLEPSFAYHMIRALVMAIMTAVVVGLPRGCNRLRKRHSLLPLGGPINCDTTMFFWFHIQNLFGNCCHLKPFNGKFIAAI